MEIRKAVKEDIREIMAVYDKAREFMKSTGNVTQWGDNYPQEDIIEADISEGVCHVVTENGIIHAVMVIQTEKEDSYQKIEDGQWPDDEPYVVIHRLASDGMLKGIFRKALEFAKSYGRNIRVDTHENNKVMRSAFEKAGFRRCGIIYVRDGSPRIAYQLDRE